MRIHLAPAGTDPATSEAAPADTGERRRHARSAVTWAGWLETGNGDMIECGVVDLSVGGAKVVLEKPIKTGARVMFKSPRFEPISARVAWSEEGVVGLQFLDGAERVMRLLGGKDGMALAPPTGRRS